ncbi:MAG: hypothetical protein HC863_02565 [Myxococcales bacterium]|nr:hypothetical protein [Myxococcales bacterium]
MGETTAPNAEGAAHVPMTNMLELTAAILDGPKRIDETMLYVHVAENQRRDLPEQAAAIAASERDPDIRIVKMLGARGSQVAANQRQAA